MKLYILRGLPGAGKSTWIRENNLSSMTLSSDEYRIRMSGLEMKDGRLVISQKNPGNIWNKLYDDMDARLADGLDVIVDATNLNPSLFGRYFEAARKYGAKIIVIDFPLSAEGSVKRQAHRDFSYQSVPEHAIIKMARLAERPLPDGISVVTPEKALSMIRPPARDEQAFEI